MRVQISAEIAASPEKIWPLLVEPENVLKWCTTYKKFEYPGDQRSGVGTPIYIEEKVGPMPLMELNFKVTEWVENEKIAFSLTSGTGTKGYDTEWTIEATPSGSRFTYMEDFILPFGIIGKFIGLVGQNVSKADIGKMLVELKNLAEA
jgi:uncharacterized protein YndB with AHSA1/START domain